MVARLVRFRCSGGSGALRRRNVEGDDLRMMTRGLQMLEGSSMVGSPQRTELAETVNMSRRS
jgi:hypothetical protein